MPRVVVQSARPSHRIINLGAHSGSKHTAHIVAVLLENPRKVRIDVSYTALDGGLLLLLDVAGLGKLGGTAVQLFEPLDEYRAAMLARLKKVDKRALAVSERCYFFGEV